MIYIFFYQSLFAWSDYFTVFKKIYSPQYKDIHLIYLVYNLTLIKIDRVFILLTNLTFFKQK